MLPTGDVADLGFKPSKQSVFTQPFKQFSTSRPLPGSPTLKEATRDRCLGWGQACPLHQLPGQGGVARPNLPPAPRTAWWQKWPGVGGCQCLPSGQRVRKTIHRNHFCLGRQSSPSAAPQPSAQLREDLASKAHSPKGSLVS